jgi:hypothetical protein
LKNVYKEAIPFREPVKTKEEFETKITTALDFQTGLRGVNGTTLTVDDNQERPIL